jgi:hypothetical protein
VLGSAKFHCAVCLLLLLVAFFFLQSGVSKSLASQVKVFSCVNGQVCGGRWRGVALALSEFCV